MFKTSWQMRKHLMIGVSENHVEGPVIPFGAMVENHPISAKDQSRLHHSGKKVLPGIFLGCVLFAGIKWKGNIMVADIEELEILDTSEIHAGRLDAKEVRTPTTRVNNFFPIADGTAQLSRRDYELREPTQRRDQPVGSEDLREELQGAGKSLNQQTKQEITMKAAMTYGQRKVISFVVITSNHEFNSTCRKKTHSQFH